MVGVVKEVDGRELIEWWKWKEKREEGVVGGSGKGKVDLKM